MKKLLRCYFETSLFLRIIACFLAGSAIGILLWYSSKARDPSTDHRFI